METQFHIQNRSDLAARLEDGALALVFAGSAPRKTADEYYPFFASRNFVYLSGIEQEHSALLMHKHCGEVTETLFLLPRDKMLERWNGIRLAFDEAARMSGVSDVRPLGALDETVDQLIERNHVRSVCLDLDKLTRDEPDDAAYRQASYFGRRYPHIVRHSLNPIMRDLRVIKKDCEIEAMRRAEQITGDGIVAMMRASRAGVPEYHLRGEFNYALSRHGVMSPAFPPIISAGMNNFQIHYYGHSGTAQSGELVLCDVGAFWDHMCTDVSRTWPVGGTFSDRQRLLYECAFRTSEHLFGLIRPGMEHRLVDETIRRYNFELLRDAGVCARYEDIGTYMWHGGAHHVGFDTHDTVGRDLVLQPGMVFCVDVGIYHEEWGIGFRLEDNCLVTEDGCENLSRGIPRTIEEIEAVLRA